LTPYVDRKSLVSSVIINVDQDVDEPWPLEVYGRDGKAVNITMEPGELILYESHTLIHGRPFAFNGSYFALDAIALCCLFWFNSNYTISY